MEISNIVYNDINDWNKAKYKLYENIYNIIKRSVVSKDPTFYFYLFEMGLTNELINITNNKEWSENISDQIIYGIEGFINGFIKTNKKIYDMLELEDIQNIIYENIKWQLDDGETHSPSILENISEKFINLE